MGGRAAASQVGVFSVGMCGDLVVSKGNSSGGFQGAEPGLYTVAAVWNFKDQKSEHCERPFFTSEGSKWNSLQWFVGKMLVALTSL